jgi:hypothetical protein
MLLTILHLREIRLCSLLCCILADVSKGYIVFESLVTINKSVRRKVPEKPNLNFEMNCGKYSCNRFVYNREDVVWKTVSAVCSILSYNYLYESLWTSGCCT